MLPLVMGGARLGLEHARPVSVGMRHDKCWVYGEEEIFNEKQRLRIV